MSEEQKKDLKIKVVLGAIVLVLGGAIVAAGPALPKILEATRKKKTSADAPARYYWIAKVMEWTFRREEAIKVYQEFWLLYGDDATNDDLDWEAVMAESNFKDDETSYLPWVVRQMDDKDEARPDPVRTGAKERELMGKVLAAMAKYYKDKRKYYESDHLYACLNALWPQGSALQQIGADGVKNKKTRSY